jgi:hypothetical protein
VRRAHGGEGRRARRRQPVHPRHFVGDPVIGAGQQGGGRRVPLVARRVQFAGQRGPHRRCHDLDGLEAGTPGAHSHYCLEALAPGAAMRGKADVGQQPRPLLGFGRRRRCAVGRGRRLVAGDGGDAGDGGMGAAGRALALAGGQATDYGDGQQTSHNEDADRHYHVARTTKRAARDPARPRRVSCHVLKPRSRWL